MSVQINDTAVVDEGAQIGDGSKVWHWAHICGGAKIGKRVSLGQNVYVSNKVVSGDDCKFRTMCRYTTTSHLKKGFFADPVWFLQMFIILDH